MKILQVIRKRIVKVFEAFYRIFCYIVPVNDHTIVFMAFHGRGYLDNPKAIYEEMQRNPQFINYKFYWVLRRKKDVPEGAIAIKYMSISYFYAFARSKFWIVNCKLPRYIRKKKTQIYLQTWHGTPLKRLGHDIQVANDTKFYRSGLDIDEMKKTYDDDVAKYNFMISPNRFCTRIFPSAFHIKKEKLLEVGYPRNDVLSHPEPRIINDIKHSLNIPYKKKIILYAPTWRDNSYVAHGYTFQLRVNFAKWKKVLGDDFVVLFKPHYLIVNSIEDDRDQELNGFLYSIDSNYDINDLYLISDVLVTDYSSVFFDYAILRRPIFFYMYDREEYQEQLRGFYLNVDTDLPGNIYGDEEKLLCDIKENNFDYQKLDEFNKEYNSFQDGKCAKRVVQYVFHSQKEGGRKCD